MSRNVVVVAPYAPGEPATHLGAAKKIELVIRLLSELGYAVHLVDSSHHAVRWAPAASNVPTDVQGVPVTLWRPGTTPSRKLGKTLNVLGAGAMARRLRALTPAFVWVYNSYAYEARVALALKRLTRCAIVLELEDLPLARGRALNPKPWLDHHFFPRLLAAADMATFVNAVSQTRFAVQGRRSMLFPSLLQQSLVAAPVRRRFASGETLRVGYFGGLSAEKGAALLIETVPRMPPGWKLVVTGVGPLTDSFARLQEQHPTRLEFHGMVSHETVNALMLGCDVVLNPHTPISLMRDGVFPFKVCEALATGALLVSTRLPSIDLDLADSVLSFDGTVDGLLNALALAPAHYAQHAEAVAATRHAVCNRFGEQPVRERLRTELAAIASR